MKTNREWLASLSDEELSEWLDGFKYGQGEFLPILCGNDSTVDAIERWLKDEHKGEEE